MKSVYELDILKESCKKLVCKAIENNLGSENVSCEIIQASAKGDNYVGVIYRVKVKKLTSLDEKNKNNTFSMIIKLPPENEARREQFSIPIFFEREILLYTDVLPLFINFQKQKGINPMENGFHEIPMCYGVVETEREEALIFEDLNSSGYEMFDRHKNLNYEHAELAMKILGKFHAISFAMKDQDFSKFKRFTEMKDLFTSKSNDEAFCEFMNMITKRSWDTLDKEKDSKYIEKINYLTNKPIIDLLIECVDPKDAEPYAIITHGDCWNNNMMYKNENGVPVDMRLLDWQISRYSSPVLDLVYYLFGCTTKPFRDNYYKKLLDVYYNSLSSFIIRLGSDPEKLFPRSAFEDQLKKFGKFGLVMASIIVPVITSNAEDIPDLDNMSEKLANGEDCSDFTFTSAKTEDIYKVRMSDVIRDVVDLGYI